MKTPKRESNLSMFDLFAEPEKAEVKCARWKRKNRVKQLKRTIARLTAESRRFRELWVGKHLEFDSPEWEAFMILRKLKTPAEDAAPDEKFEYWIMLRKAAALALDAACFAAKDYGKARGRADCLAEIAENARQETLLCTDAEQQTERKEKE